jgi:hypothetical protein
VTKKLNQLIRIFKEEMRILLSICLGVFFFVLFFQSFPLDHFDFNNRLLFVAGLAAIVFLFMVLVRVIFPWFKQRQPVAGQEPAFHSYLGSFIIWAMNSVAFPFYLHYIGAVEITFFVVFKVVLICLAPVAVLRVYDMIFDLRHENEALLIEKRILHMQLEKYEEEQLNSSITMSSDNSAESVVLSIADIAFVKSADNYVEVVYREGEIFHKKLLRNTLRNIELQLQPYSVFIRCHRTCIVNTLHTEKLSRDFNTHWIAIKGFEEQIPVSRQYLMKLKDTL